MTLDSESLFPRASQNVYDYIDGDGDMFSVDVVDECWLALSVLRHGRTAILTCVISEPEEARKIAGRLIEWADNAKARLPHDEGI